MCAPSSSSSSSFDRLPPAMRAQGATPAPSEDHQNMDHHGAGIALDEDDQDTDYDSMENHRTLHHHPSRHFSDHSPQSYSRSSTPPVPSTTATVLAHPPATPNSARSPSSFSDASLPSSGPLSATASPSHTASSEQHHQAHSISPFSFFSHGSSHSGDHSAVSSKTLRIELAQPEIVLMNGQVTTLEGVVYVNLYKNIKVKTLQLEFSGRSSVTWIDDNAYSPATRHTTAPHIEHTWNLISHQHKQPPTLLQSGQHAYPFALELPDTLPETLTTTHGKVAYRLTATLTRPGLTNFNSSTVTMPVTIHRRHPVQASRAYQRGGRAASSPEDKVKYKITMPQVRVPHSTKIPLQVSITAPTARTHVQVLQVGLWERVVYRADGRKRVDMRLVKIQKSEGWERPPNHETEAWNWNKVLLFDMPQMGSDLNQCNPSADNGLMKVGHILRFSILGTDGTKRFRVENEIGLKVLAFEDEYQMDPEEEADGFDGELPSYLTSFTTPRVSFDSERNMDPAEDDLLRLMVQRIHLPTYAESEEDANSRGTSRDVSRNTSRAPSRNASPERSLSTGSLTVPHLSHHHHHFHHHHQSLPHSLLGASYSPVPSTVPLSSSPLACPSEPISTDVSFVDSTPVSLAVVKETDVSSPLHQPIPSHDEEPQSALNTNDHSGCSSNSNSVVQTTSAAPNAVPVRTSE
ncbi:hypothetical protein BGZ54_009830 [Gamsiella multidivaricata]|nr:hypothetical protein BGZ54_009830 [Gamsiella multidivaricata]